MPVAQFVWGFHFVEREVLHIFSSVLSNCIYCLSAYFCIVELSLLPFTSSTQIQVSFLGFHLLTTGVTVKKLALTFVIQQYGTQS